MDLPWPCSVAHLGSSLSLRSGARLGASLFRLIFLPRWHCGAAPASRNFTWFEPFAHGSHFATLRIVAVLARHIRFAASLSMIDFSILGASVSFRNFHGLGASLAVFVDSHLGSSVALRSARSVTYGPLQPCVGFVRIGILWLSLFSRDVLESVQLGRATALPLWSWASMGCLSIG